jgi:hypothetical protein
MSNMEPTESCVPTPAVHVPNNKGNFHQQVDNSINKPLPWIFISISFGALGLGMAVASIPRLSDMSDRMVQTQNAELARMADVIERAARAEERADLLQYYVMENDGKLVQRGLLKPEETFSGQVIARERAKLAKEKETKK